MKYLLLCFVILALLHRVKPAYDDGGYSTLTMVTNDDPTSCLVRLSLTSTPKLITFTTTVIQNQYSDCTHHDLEFISMFRGDQISGAVVLGPVGSTVKSGSLTLTQVAAYNGTACLYAGFDVDNGKKYYSCQFKFNNVVFIVDFGLNPLTGDFAISDWSNLFNPYLGVTQKVNQNGIDVWKANIFFPKVVGMLYNQCGSWSSIIPSLSTRFTITGTELQSNTLNLNTLWNGYFFNSIWIRKKNAPANNYIVIPPYNPTLYPFTNTVNNCSDTGVTYQKLLPDMNYCKGGCDLSAFVMQGSAITLLPTAGFVTQSY